MEKVSRETGPGAGSPVLAEVVRSGFVEGRHRGIALLLDADGVVTASWGDVRAPILTRSTLKPLQAVGMLRLGVPLSAPQVALACASHDGEPIHTDGVLALLDSVGLGPDALQTPPDWPGHEATRYAVIRAGGERTALAMGCSGKHAAMLATCVHRGWDTAGYRDAAHPLQQALAATVAELTGEPVAATVVDGCGAPQFATTLLGTARAFAAIATADPASEEGRVAAAVRSRPELVSGTTRDERVLLTAVPGAIGKYGAEASYVVALPDGRVAAVKIEDGGDRARRAVMGALLARAGVLEEPGVDAAGVRAATRVPLTGAHDVVGEVRAVL